MAIMSCSTLYTMSVFVWHVLAFSVHLSEWFLLCGGIHFSEVGANIVLPNGIPRAFRVPLVCTCQKAGTSTNT